jgi:hypothetical protein
MVCLIDPGWNPGVQSSLCSSNALKMIVRYLAAPVGPRAHLFYGLERDWGSSA